MYDYTITLQQYEEFIANFESYIHFGLQINFRSHVHFHSPMPELRAKPATVSQTQLNKEMTEERYLRVSEFARSRG